MESAHPIILPFLDYLKFERRFSQHTIISYHTDLTSFFDFLVTTYDYKNLKEITHSHIRSWLAFLKEGKLAAKSINRKISTLRSFYKFQVKQGLLLQNPMIKIIAPKNEKRLPQFVADKDIRRLLNSVEFTEDWQGKTDKLLISILYNTGIRLSELISLKPSSINFSNSSIKVIGKGNKERIIPVSADLLNEIKKYQKEWLSIHDQSSNNLFVGSKGKPLNPKAVYNTIKKYLTLVTTIEKRSPHVLRHSFATHLSNNGADLNAVKELLGHTSLAATQVYTHNNISKLLEIYKKAHPKEQ